MEIKKLIKKSKGVVQNADVAIPHSFHTITTDTRILEKNDIFVALKGANADGNKYIEEAIEKGASMIFTDQELDSKSVPIIKVEDAYKCLYDFASCYLEETYLKNIKFLKVKEIKIIELEYHKLYLN